MNVFSKPFHDVTFSDVEAFCSQEHPESTTLDYKKEVPRDLAKHFATFSNTLGGVIIIGVEEDPATGTPLKWEGVNNDSKLIERVNQFAANVVPLPSFSVRVTDAVNHKVFLLIGILEGDAPPYQTTNDPTVWLRTGNTSTPLRQANREELVRMVEKKNSATEVRKQNLLTANTIFDARLCHAEKERKRLIEEADRKGQTHSLPMTPYGTDCSFLTMYLQPFYPKHQLAEPWDIKAGLNELVTTASDGDNLPPMDMEPIPNGLASTRSLMTIWDTKVRVYQIYVNGLIHYKEDVRRVEPNGNAVIAIWQIADDLYKVLVFARKLYAKYNYSDLMTGTLKLQDALGAEVQVIIPAGVGVPFRRAQYRLDKLPDYSWPLELDTHILNDDVLLLGFFKDVLRRVYWSLGVESMQDATIEQWLQQRNWR